MSLRYYQYKPDLSILVKLNISIDEDAVFHDVPPAHSIRLAVEVKKCAPVVRDDDLSEHLSQLIALLQSDLDQSLSKRPVHQYLRKEVENFWQEISREVYNDSEGK